MPGTLVGDVLRTFTWRHALLTQVLFVALEIVAVLSFSVPFHGPMTVTGSWIIIGETVAFSIVLALLVANQVIARGARRFRAYAAAIVIASVFAGMTQFGIREWLDLYTTRNPAWLGQPGLPQPSRNLAQRLMQVVYVCSDTLTYGVLLILVYVDYEDRERLLRRVRAGALDRARQEQHLAHSRLAALRSEVDSAALLQTLQDVRAAFEQESAGGEQRLDELIEHLRAQLGPVARARAIAVTR